MSDTRDYERNLISSLSAKIPEDKVRELPAAESEGTPLVEGGTFATMTDDEKRAAGFVEISTGRWRWCPNGYQGPAPSEAPYGHVYGRFQNGRSAFHTHGKEDIGDPEVLEDYADDERGAEACRLIGHKYLVLKDGRQGPAPFGSRAQEDAYGRLTRQRRRDKGEGGPPPMEAAKQAFERKWGKPFTPLPIERLTYEQLENMEEA